LAARFRIDSYKQFPIILEIDADPDFKILTITLTVAIGSA